MPHPLTDKRILPRSEGIGGGNGPSGPTQKSDVFAGHRGFQPGGGRALRVWGRLAPERGARRARGGVAGWKGRGTLRAQRAPLAFRPAIPPRSAGRQRVHGRRSEAETGGRSTQRSGVTERSGVRPAAPWLWRGSRARSVRARSARSGRSAAESGTPSARGPRHNHGRGGRRSAAEPPTPSAPDPQRPPPTGLKCLEGAPAGRLGPPQEELVSGGVVELLRGPQGGAADHGWVAEAVRGLFRVEAGFRSHPRGDTRRPLLLQMLLRGGDRYA
ncbi:hypothetical protein EES41_36720 [Streptomyces sp. ADI95-16]|nr:hypothetical protein EES41_36720 [Streptomyces sp. ADI95-16]